MCGGELGLDSGDCVGVGVGGGCVWDDECVACGVVAVMVGVDEGEGGVACAGQQVCVAPYGAGEVGELGIDEEDGVFGGVDEGVATGIEVG